MVACRVARTLALMSFVAPSSFAGERELEDALPPSSIEEIEGPLQLAYPKPEIRRSLFPWIPRQMQALPPFLADTKLYLRYRTSDTAPLISMVL